jgi:hypothetical protein
MGDHVESKVAAAAAIPNQCGNNFKLIIQKEGKEIVCWHKGIYSAG